MRIKSGPCLWSDKPYYSLDHYFKSVYGKKIYKTALNAGMTCPVRDGSLGTKGCIFCSEGGSGDFAAGCPSGLADAAEIKKQLAAGREFIKSKYNGDSFLAYLQAYTNTYAPVDKLAEIYEAALDDPHTIGLSIATRPDCLPPDVIKLLKELKEKYPEKCIWVELGLQTIHKASINYIRRGYDNSVFEMAVHDLEDAGIPVIVHVILGLPDETKDMMLQTIEYLNTFSIFGIKLQLLHVLNGTDLAADYQERKFDLPGKEEYTDIVVSCIEHLSPDIVVHRITGDGPKDLLIAPLWSADKKSVLNGIHAEMKRRGSYQGIHYA